MSGNPLSHIDVMGLSSCYTCLSICEIKYLNSESKRYDVLLSDNGACEGDLRTVMTCITGKLGSGFARDYINFQARKTCVKSCEVNECQHPGGCNGQEITT